MSIYVDWNEHFVLSQEGFDMYFDRRYKAGYFEEEQRSFLEMNYDIVELALMTEAQALLVQQEMYDYVYESVCEKLEEYGFARVDLDR